MNIQSITINTAEGVSVIDVTQHVLTAVRQTTVRNGLVLVATQHTTTGLAVNENEPRLIEDITAKLEEFAPSTTHWRHDDIALRDCPADERVNGHSHIKSLLLQQCVSIPVSEGKPLLGKWQSVLFFELDGGRTRTLTISVVGGKQ